MADWHTFRWPGLTDTRYGYDELGRLETVTSVVASTNALGELVLTSNVVAHAYDEVGNRAATVRPNGIDTVYQYSDLNRLTDMVYLGAGDSIVGRYTYALAADGRRTTAWESGVGTSNVVSYTYDELNRLTAESAIDPSGNGYDAEYSYDLVGNRLERLVTVGQQTLRTQYTYNDNDQLLSESSDLETAVGYVPLGRGAYVAANSTSGPGGGSGQGLHFAAKTMRVPSAIPFWSTEALPWLLALALFLPFLHSAFWRASVLASRLSPFDVGRWMLDVRCSNRRIGMPMRAVSSLLAMAFLIGPGNVETLAQGADLYEALSATDWAPDNSVTTYQYDANGSLIAEETQVDGSVTVSKAYNYNLANRLSQSVVTELSGTNTTVTTTAYVYNAAGVRVRKDTTVEVDGSQVDQRTQVFLVDSFNHTGHAQVLEEHAGDGTASTVTYTIGDDVLSQTKFDGDSGSVQHLLVDGHGSTRQVADATGWVGASYTYDAYGMAVSQSTEDPALDTSLLYTGEQFDEGLGQYYLRARYYNPANGRLNRVDPFAGNQHDPQSLHKYTYCHNEPVNAVDPSGMATEGLVGIVVTSAIIGVLSGLASAGYVSQKMGPGAKWPYLLLYSVLGAVSGAALGFIGAFVSSLGLGLFASLTTAFVLSLFVLVATGLASFAIRYGRAPNTKDEWVSIVMVSTISAMFAGLGGLHAYAGVAMTFFTLFFEMILVPFVDEAASIPDRDGQIRGWLEGEGVRDAY